MSDKKGFMGLAALAAAGAGAAMLMKKTREINEEENLHVKETTANYRNTERGKHDKNSKGIYYSNGNYEAFARPEKPEGVDDKHAYIVGSGLASLAAACFLSGSFPTAVSFTGSPCVFLLMTTEGRLYIETEAYVFCNCRHSFPVSYLLCAVSLCTCSAYSWKLQIQS